MTELRVKKFNELIKQELGKVIFNFLDVKPDILITITRINTAADLFSAIVFVSIYPNSEAKEIFGKMNHSIYEIQQLLNKKLKIRPVPKIIFRQDKNPEEASEIERLIADVKEK